MKFTLGLFLASMLQISASSSHARKKERETERKLTSASNAVLLRNSVKAFCFVRNTRSVIMKTEFAKIVRNASNSSHS